MPINIPRQIITYYVPIVCAPPNYIAGHIAYRPILRWYILRAGCGEYHAARY